MGSPLGIPYEHLSCPYVTVLHGKNQFEKIADSIPFLRPLAARGSGRKGRWVMGMSDPAGSAADSSRQRMLEKVRRPATLLSPLPLSPGRGRGVELHQIGVVRSPLPLARCGTRDAFGHVVRPPHCALWRFRRG